jgi:enamine deaminase RidA (YjgF/YER057c/UK114 family)
VASWIVFLYDAQIFLIVDFLPKGFPVMLKQKLAELGLELPAVPAAAASYVGYKVTGNLVIVSGQLPLANGKPTLTGKLEAGAEITDAYAAAQQCALNTLAQLDAAIGGDWSRFVQVVRLGGFVGSDGQAFWYGRRSRTGGDRRCVVAAGRDGGSRSDFRSSQLISAASSCR